MILKHFLTILVLVNAIGISISQLLGPIVEVPGLGKLRGQHSYTLVGNRHVNRFKGIPYAHPPIGERRFMPSELFEGPLPTGSNEEFKAQDFMTSCVQNGVGGGSVGSEDCLGINVFSPELPTGENPNLKPVMLFVHGGAFTLGSGDMFTGARLLDRDIVLVTINYRLGLFGFFSLGTDETPGNAALYDVLTALQWINKYIAYFGGDPNRVTVAGQSAGSALVTDLLFSPLTEGLFHGVIGMSGSALSFWALENDHLPSALEVAEIAGCNSTDADGQPDLRSITNCMKAISHTEVNQAGQAYITKERFEGRMGFGPIAPIVQKVGARKFLVERPIDILREKRQHNVPLMGGSMKHDGTFILALVYLSFLEPAGKLEDAHFMKTGLVPALLSALGVEDDSHAIYDGLAVAYLGDKRDSGDFEEMKYGLIDMHSVLFMKSGGYRIMQLHSELQPNTYWYSFDYHGRYSLSSLLNLVAPTPIPAGISHGDELMYIFYIVFTLPGQDQVVSERMLDYWANFVKFGNPTPEGASHHDGSPMIPWPGYSVQPDGDKYMSIDTEPTILTNYQSTYVGSADDLTPAP